MTITFIAKERDTCLVISLDKIVAVCESCVSKEEGFITFIYLTNGMTYRIALEKDEDSLVSEIRHAIEHPLPENEYIYHVASAKWV